MGLEQAAGLGSWSLNMLAGLSGVTMTVHFLRCTSERYIADEIKCTVTINPRNLRVTWKIATSAEPDNRLEVMRVGAPD
jgi:hypothetical protein